MSKILVERPRVGRRTSFRQRRSHFERRARSRQGDEALPEVMPMRWNGTRSPNENLMPLRRFLMSRRSCLWDDVYSELRTQLAPKNTIDMHIMQHLWDFVFFEARHRAGHLVLRDRRGREYCHSSRLPAARGRGYFYVSLESGRLLWQPPERRKQRKQPR